MPFIASDQFLVLTDDLELYSYLVTSAVDTINFNPIRLLGWGV
ncbi:MAG: hypothetical protein ABL921_01330 [Pirellula sp.]